jgi:hypothetical protein
MKKLLVILCAILLVIGVASAASAITDKDLYEAGHDYMDPFGENSSVSRTSNIIVDGFNPVTQDVTSVSAELYLSDDSGEPLPWIEVAGFADFDGVAGFDVATSGKGKGKGGNVHAAEPATMFMFGTGLIGMALIVRKKFGKV